MGELGREAVLEGWGGGKSGECLACGGYRVSNIRRTLSRFQRLVSHQSLQTKPNRRTILLEIGDQHGPFDLAFIPIWRGASLSLISRLGLRLHPQTPHHALLQALHASPEDALHIHKDVKSRHSVAMHFACFAGSHDEAMEPLVRLVEGRESVGVGDWGVLGGFGVVDVGGGGIVEI